MKADAPRAAFPSSSSSSSSSSFTRYDYNALGQLTNQWGGGNYPVAYSYDSEGRMTTLSTYRAGSFTATTWATAAAGQTPDMTTWTYAPGFSQSLEKQYASGPPLKYIYHANGSGQTPEYQNAGSAFHYFRRQSSCAVERIAKPTQRCFES